MNPTNPVRSTSGRTGRITLGEPQAPPSPSGLTMLGSWPLSQAGASTTADSFSDATGQAALGAANNATLNVPSWTIPTHTKDRPGIVTGSSDNTSLEISNGGPAIPMVSGYRQAAMSFVIYVEFYSEQRGTQYWDESREPFGREVIACCDPDVDADTGPAGSWCIYRRRTAWNQATWRLGGYVRGASGAKSYFGTPITGIASFNYLSETLGTSGTAHRIVLTQGPAGASLWFDNTQFTLPGTTQGWVGLTQAITIGCTPYTGHANRRSPMWGRVDQAEVWKGQINPTAGDGLRPAATTSLRYKIPAGAVLFNVASYPTVQAAIDAAHAAPGSNNWVIQTDTNWRQNPFRSSIAMKRNCRGLIGVMMRKAPNESSKPPTAEQSCNTRSNAEGYAVEILNTKHATVGGTDPWAASGGWRYLGCKFDGNARKQDWSPNATRDKTKYCGFNLQFAFCSSIVGDEAGEDDLTVTHELCDFFDSTAEGVSVDGRCDVLVNSCRMYGTFRKAMVIENLNRVHLTARTTESFNSAARIGGLVDNGGGLIDVEPFESGDASYVRWRCYDSWTDGQIDDKTYQVTPHTQAQTWYTNVHMSGGWLSLQPMRTGADNRRPASSVIWQRSTIAYYRKGFTSKPEAAGGTFPLMMQGFTNPGALFEECVFLASGRPQCGVGSATPYNPVTDDGARACSISYQTLGVDAGRLMTLRNCEFRGHLVSHVSKPNRRCFVFPSIPSSRSIEIDGLQIDAMFADTPIVLGGLTLRYRNVVHQGRPPGTAISSIASGGTYVAI